MNERFLKNSVDILYIESGELLYKIANIQKEIVQFYKQLLGSSASALPGVDIDLIREGSQISPSVVVMLVQLVTHKDINDALFDIDDSKAPGMVLIVYSLRRPDTL